jgi:hypothetical protein
MLTKVTSSVLDQYAVFPSGTVMLFQQSSAPIGWTKQTTHNDKALRVVSGSTSSGGSVAFSTAFASQAVAGSVSINNTMAVGATTLSTAQMPSHNHNSGLRGNYAIYGSAGVAYDSAYDITSAGSATPITSSTGSGGSHTHSISGSVTGSFSGTSINMAVQYVDVIFASKD